MTRSRTRPSGSLYVAILLLAIVATLSTASACNPGAVTSTVAFQSCSIASGLSFETNKGKSKGDIDPTRASFCGSPACLVVYRQLWVAGELDCLKAFSTSSLKLWSASGGQACFGSAVFDDPTPPPTPPPTPTPTPPPTPQLMPPSEQNPPPASESSEPPTDSPSLAPALTNSGSRSAGGDDDVTEPPTQDDAANPSSSRPAGDGGMAFSPAATPSSTSSGSSSSDGSGSSASQLSQSNGSKLDTASNHDSITPGMLWLLVGSIALVAGIAFVVFYRRLSTSDEPLPDRSAYAKQTSTRCQRTSSTTQEGSIDGEPVVAIGGQPVSSPSTRSECVVVPIEVPVDLVDGGGDELLSSCRIPFEKLVFGERLSQGGFGEVYRGSYRGEAVAIKTLLPHHRKSAQQIQNFMHEIRLLAALDHERIVQFIGVSWDSLNELCAVMEFMERGDLRSLLIEYDARGAQPRGFDAGKTRIALQVAHALTYLHSLEPVVLHRDLKSRNILLDAECNAKVTDFGVSRERSDATMTAGVGSCLWMAPEVMLGERYDEKADVFSFGVLLSEIDLHSRPYSHALEQGSSRRLPETSILQMVSMGLLAVEFSDEPRSAVAQLGRACVALDPLARPAVSEALHRLHQIVHGEGGFV